MTQSILGTATALAILLAAPVAAETLRATTTFNTSIQQKAEVQPADGMAVTYPVTYAGGLEGCTAAVAESLYPKDGGDWGIYEVAADVTCPDGGFAFTSTGAWDAKGFHGTGSVTEGSGTGSYASLAGRLAQSGSLAPAANDSMDLSYELMIDRRAP
jgi:Protein of unknown function (DUF3224)